MMIVAVDAHNVWLLILTIHADSNGLASAVLAFVFVVTDCCLSLTMS